MHQHRPPYPRAKAKVKVQREEGHGARYLALLIAGALLAVVVSHNAKAEEGTQQRPAKAIWTDHNTHDPGLVADPVKVRDMQAELAEEDAARNKPKPHDGWVLQSFGIGPQASTR